LKTALLTSLAVLAAWMVLLLLAQGFIKNRDTRTDCRQMTRALDHFYERTARYPANLAELIGKSPLRQGWKRDGWGKAYRYSTATGGTSYLLISAGRDGRFNTGDDLTFYNGPDRR
jgi:hypothetical protein